MADQTIVCPNCGKRIPLTKALGAQLEDRLRRDITSEFKTRERQLKEDHAEAIAAARKEAEKELAKKARVEASALRKELGEKEEALEQAQKRELRLIKRQRDLDAKERTLELELQRKLESERKKLEEDIGSKLAEESRLKELEKDRRLVELQHQIEDLKRKAEQGSIQILGEAVEVDLERNLRGAFPQDEFEPISRGIRGADLLHKVRDPSGHICGSILWEFKSAKSWSDAWIVKLKDDQRSEKADIAALTSVVLPRGVSHFGEVNAVWVMDLQTLIGGAAALRSGLIEVHASKSAEVGKSEKMDFLYGYLAGPEFRQRIEAMVEAFISMRDDLDRERRSMEASWSRREKQIQKVIRNVGGMYGDVRGIIGASLPEIQQLEPPEPARLLDKPEESTEAV